MTLKERVIDFFHMIREYAEFQLEKNAEVDFVGDTMDEILENRRKWIEGNRFRRRYYQEKR